MLRAADKGAAYGSGVNEDAPTGIKPTEPRAVTYHRDQNTISTAVNALRRFYNRLVNSKLWTLQSKTSKTSQNVGFKGLR